MWFDSVNEIAEMFRNSFPLSFLFFVPIFIIISPVSPVGAASEFAVYRMQQYDLYGSSYGCRNALVNVEARSIESKQLTRKCVVLRLAELTIDRYRDIMVQHAGGLLVLLPEDLSTLSPEARQHLMELEQDLLQEETQVPVFFTHETPEVVEMYDDIKSSTNADQAGSAFEALLSSATANGFQLVVNGPQSKALSDFQVANIQGKLSGYGIEEKLPTIAIVTHYDTFGVAPSLAKGGDSNGSGVVALLEISRLFSKLYTNSRTHAKFNLLFLLSGAGKFNYQGSKRWSEDQIDSTEASLLQDVAYVLCLDTIGSTKELRLHVSKPPKEGTAGEVFMKNLEAVTQQLYPDVTFSMVHKKINLGDEFRAWEHERYSLKRLPAFTLSHLENHKKLEHQTIADTSDAVDMSALTRNVKIVVEALARQIYNLTQDSNVDIFSEGLQVEEEQLSAWLSYLTSRSRAAQLMDKDSQVVLTLEQVLSRYLKDIKKITFKADKRDPEFVFYNGAEFTMYAYSVKPAVFDLFLALGIGAYLAVMYLLMQNFHRIYAMLRKTMGPVRVKQQ